jgi:hypothetical protein
MHELIINLKKEVILRGDWIQNVYAWVNNSGQYNYNMMFNKTNWGQNEKNRHEIKIKAKFCMIWNDTSYIGWIISVVWQQQKFFWIWNKMNIMHEYRCRGKNN